MDKVVLITGATGGIGREVAFRFSKNQDHLILGYHQDQDIANEVAKKCRSLGAKSVQIFPLDLEDAASINHLVTKGAKEFGRIDTVVNVAGYLSTGFLEQQNDEDIDRMIDVNFRGLVKLTKVSLPYLKQGIVNVGSNLGISGRKRLAVYSATKFAVRGLTKSLAQELPQFRIYTVNPGLTATRMGGFCGVPPEKVAEIIWKAAEGKYRAPSGSDINVNEYLWGERWKNFIRAARAIKRLIRNWL